jgi:hypothetical protein
MQIDLYTERIVRQEDHSDGFALPENAARKQKNSGDSASIINGLRTA